MNEMTEEMNEQAKPPIVHHAQSSLGPVVGAEVEELDLDMLKIGHRKSEMIPKRASAEARTVKNNLRNYQEPMSYDPHQLFVISSENPHAHRTSMQTRVRTSEYYSGLSLE